MQTYIHIYNIILVLIHNKICLHDRSFYFHFIWYMRKGSFTKFKQLVQSEVAKRVEAELEHVYVCLTSQP